MVAPLLLLLACHGDTPECVTEIPYDGIDQDCDGADLVDADRDGSPWPVDCDDADAGRAPGLTELTGDGVDQDCDGRDGRATGRVDGTGDGGFGTRVLLHDGVVWTTAPYETGGGPAEGVLYREDVEVLRGEPGDFLGRGLAAYGDTVLVTTRTRLLTAEGEEVATGVTAPLAANGSVWVAATADGWRASTGEVGTGRPDSLAILEDRRIAAGYARGDTCVRIAEVSIPRPAPGDECGYAVTADLVGAPGTGKVYRYTDTLELVSEGTGRYGHALLDGHVGAPLSGTAAQGAVYRIDGTLLAEGTAEDEQLGFSLSAEDLLAVGAPGGAGVVHLLAP